MNNQTKVLLTVTGIPGGIQRLKSTSRKTAEVDTLSSKRKRKVPYIEKVYETEDCSQKINIGYDAYLYMTGDDCPSFIKPVVWKRMTRKQKLEAHFQRTCEYLNGKDFSYIILED